MEQFNLVFTITPQRFKIFFSDWSDNVQEQHTADCIIVILYYYNYYINTLPGQKKSPFDRQIIGLNLVLETL